jgi:hypothetical protein
MREHNMDHMSAMKVLLSVVVFFLFSYPAFAQSDSGFDLNAIAKDAEQRLRACPRREVVFKSKRIWRKEAWGPPSDVIADAKPNDSSLYPYVLTVEFGLSISYGPERKSKTEADRDTELLPSYDPLVTNTSRNRNVYLVSRDGIRLKIREVVYGNHFSDTPGMWVSSRGTPLRWVERTRTGLINRSPGRLRW